MNSYYSLIRIPFERTMTTQSSRINLTSLRSDLSLINRNTLEPDDCNAVKSSKML